MTPWRFYKGLLNAVAKITALSGTDSEHQLQQQIEIIHYIQHKKVVYILYNPHLIKKKTLKEFNFLLNYRYDCVIPLDYAECSREIFTFEALDAIIKASTQISGMVKHPLNQ